MPPAHFVLTHLPWQLPCLFCLPRHPEALSSDTVTIMQELRGADDHTIINQYFDAIDMLVSLVNEGQGEQAKQEGLCDTVLHLQDVSAWRVRASWSLRTVHVLPLFNWAATVVSSVLSSSETAAARH
jgi:hypothetical protein